MVNKKKSLDGARDNKERTKKITEIQYRELENLAKRLQADFDNYRKRSQKEKEDFAAFLNADMILRIIPVMDNFQLALKHLPPELENDNWAKGIFHIERQLEQILADQGVSKISAVGQEFNPHVHEAIEEVPSDAPEGNVIEEITPGYKLNDKVIKHAKVKVSAGKSELSKQHNKKLTSHQSQVTGDDQRETTNE